MIILRATAAGTVAVALAIVATACTEPTSEPPAPTSSAEAGAPPVISEPVLPRLTVGDRGWGTGDVRVADLSAVTFLGGTAIVAGTDATSTRWIEAVDAGTGRTLWSRSSIDPLPGTPGDLWTSEFTAVDDGGAGLVVVEFKVQGDEPLEHDHALAALSAADGSVVWTRTLLTRDEATAAVDRPQAAVLLNDGDVVDATGVVLAAVGWDRALFGSATAEPGSLRTVALDPLTGEERWRADDVVGRWVVGDAVVATTNANVPSGITGGPVVLDAATGARRWTSGPELDRTATSRPSADLIMVDFAERPERVLLSLADGSVVAETGAVLASTADATTDYVAWIAYEPSGDPAARLLTFAAGDPAPSLASVAPPADGVTLALSAGGYLWTERTGSTATDRTAVALDRSGTESSDPVAGTPFAATAEWLVTVDRASSNAFSVHRITR